MRSACLLGWVERETGRRDAAQRPHHRGRIASPTAARAEEFARLEPALEAPRQRTPSRILARCRSPVLDPPGRPCGVWRGACCESLLNLGHDSLYNTPCYAARRPGGLR